MKVRANARVEQVAISCRACGWSLTAETALVVELVDAHQAPAIDGILVALPGEREPSWWRRVGANAYARRTP